jgi:hypothetical protein
VSYITITCRNFRGSYSHLNCSHNLRIPRRAVFRAIITLGFQKPPDIFHFGWRGLVHRFGIALSSFSFLDWDQSGICLSNSFGNLDMSEKAAAAYWYGMALAKLVAESELGIPWLAHLDSLRASGALVTSSSGNQRADFVGRGRHSAWHVIESKGRTHSYSKSLIKKAKAQAASVKSINGIAPITSSACISSLHTRPISVLLEDPPTSKNEDFERWKIPDHEFFSTIIGKLLNICGDYDMNAD